MSKDIARCWEFASGSNPNKKYETLQYTDGSTSCNCMGWTRPRAAADGSRSCKHTRMVDMGAADRECTAQHDYTQTVTRQAPKASTPLAAPKSKKKTSDHVIIPVRKILWTKQGS